MEFLIINNCIRQTKSESKIYIVSDLLNEISPARTSQHKFLTFYNH